MQDLKKNYGIVDHNKLVLLLGIYFLIILALGFVIHLSIFKLTLLIFLPAIILWLSMDIFWHSTLMIILVFWKYVRLVGKHKMDLMISQYTFILPIALTGIIFALSRKDNRVFDLKESKIPFLLLFWSLIISTIFAWDYTYSIKWLFISSQFVIIYYFFKSTIIDIRKFEILYYVIIIATFVPILFGLKEFLSASGRIYSVLNNPNEVAAFMGFAIFLILPMIFLVKQNKFRIFSLIFLFFSVLVLMGTQSRGGQLAFLGSFLIYLILKGENLKNKIIIISSFVLLTAFILVTVGKPFIGRFTDISKMGFSEYDRIGLWIASWKLFLKSPIWGIGVNNFYKYYIYEHPLFFHFKFQHVSVAHNLFLNTLAEQGVIGIVALISVHIIIIKKIVKYLKSQNETLVEIGRALAGFFTFFIIHNILDTVWTSYAHEVSTMVLMLFILFLNISYKFYQN